MHIVSTTHFNNLFSITIAVVGLWIVIFSCFLSKSLGKVAEFRYFGQSICDINERSNHGCLKKIPRARSIMECVIQCNTDNDCVGVSFDDQGVYFKHYTCPLVMGCTTSNANHLYTSKKCANGGQFLPSSQSCQCTDTWVGPTCQERPRDCDELITYGYAQGSYYTFLDPDKDGQKLNPVYCTIRPQKRYSSLSVLRHEGRRDFNMTWDEFRNGYFIDGEHFWMGLEHWHAMSKIGYTTLFIIIDFGNSGILYRHYKQFMLNGAYHNFTFTHGQNWDNARGKISRTGNKLHDCFGPYQNTSFSTWDRDNDEAGDDNCAARAGSGWWYLDCNTVCNLFGWGADHWLSKPSYQRLSVLGVDMDSVIDKLNYVFMYLQKE